MYYQLLIYLTKPNLVSRTFILNLKIQRDKHRIRAIYHDKRTQHL